VPLPWRRLPGLIVGLALAVTACTGATGAQDEPGIDVIDVSGPLDASALAFISDSIEEAAVAGQVLALVQVNSRAVLDAEGFERLRGLIAEPPLPVAVWVGPAPAQAFGGASLLPFLASHAAIAPGSEWGVTNPVVLGTATPEVTGPDDPEPAEGAGLDLEPTIRQYLQSLDGESFHTASGEVVVSTIREVEGGLDLVPQTFRKPGLGVRFFRLAVLPEAAFFFLMVGLTIVSFESFALGPGVAAGVAGVSLLLGGWGLATLPARWWAVALAVAGWALLTWAHQRGGWRPVTLAGAALVMGGGLFLIDGRDQLDPRWYLVLPTVLAVLFFFLLAMPTVQRARLSTQTIGRESLVGHTGRALVDFSPDGLVVVDGARWRATAHREAGIVAGSEVVVTGVDGMFLEVDFQVTNRET
jgi:membrane-bound serine protease (ClpP class)